MDMILPKAIGMKAVESIQAVQDGAPGSFCIETVTEGGETYKRLRAKLPHGDVGGFALEPAPAHIPGVWEWNGNETKPTFKREVRLRGRWVGVIKGGRMITTEDANPVVAPAAKSLPPPPPPTVRTVRARRK